VPSVCFYFQVHQPFRLRRYTVFDSLSAHPGAAAYFDDEQNRAICRKVAEKCYLPANRMMLDLIRRHAGRFRISYSLSGVLLEQLQLFAPEALETFVELVRTGCVEILAETYHHSLASLYAPSEFRAQVELHGERVWDLFGARPRAFRNTELIYSNDVAARVGAMGFTAILAEGAAHVLGGRSPNRVYRPRGMPGPSLLLKNFRLSDDIAFRFSDRGWEEWPLTPGKYASWIGAAGGRESVVNLFMDYETFGEHQWADAGVFEFFRALPGSLLEEPGVEFRTVSEVADRHVAADELDVPEPTSWADAERDLSAWTGNAMQQNALFALHEIEGPLKATGNPRLLEDWRRLGTSDHVYYMCTKHLTDGAVHTYFSPYESPYDAYINFMNAVDNLRRRTEHM
jgi:alpha-amylase